MWNVWDLVFENKRMLNVVIVDGQSDKNQKIDEFEGLVYVFGWVRKQKRNTNTGDINKI